MIIEGAIGAIIARWMSSGPLCGLRFAVPAGEGGEKTHRSAIDKDACLGSTNVGLRRSCHQSGRLPSELSEAGSTETCGQWTILAEGL